MFGFLLIVKMAIFTGQYLGLWYEHSVVTNTITVGQHSLVVKFLREQLFE